jgi:pSer/pThr/pTyr-binding forkhead associated (FHA) protein
MAYLKILQGIDAGKQIALDQEIMLGRQVGSDICLPDPRVSRTHARISPQEAHFVIEDLQSSNGTLLRGSRLFPGVPYRLNHEDEIKIGSTLMVFIDESGEAD